MDSKSPYPPHPSLESPALSPELSAAIQQYMASGGSAESLAEQLLMQAHRPAPEGVRVDVDRRRRCGYPEVVYGEGKSLESIRQAIRRILESEPEVLITRVDPSVPSQLAAEFPCQHANTVAGTLRVRRDGDFQLPISIHANALRPESHVEVAVVSAGTTDQRVAMEAVETLAWMGVSTGLIQDVGVAGPYRLLPFLPLLRQCRSIVVAAGMEAALASVLAAHVASPVVAVPTSVGYGAHFSGLAALLGMLNSCAANVTVVNIDAGFKAGFVAGLIARTNSPSTIRNH